MGPVSRDRKWFGKMFALFTVNLQRT